MEENYIQKLSDFIIAISMEKPQVIALQEVNQTCCEAVVPKEELLGYCPCEEGIVIRRDNHVFHVAQGLWKMGREYYWTWLPLKKGYDKYDEGIALMSTSPIVETDIVLTSGVNDYSNWKTRKLLGIRTESSPKEWFYSAHYGWWNDAEEPFQGQWDRTLAHMKDKETVWLMGDFNSPAEVRGEGYDRIAETGWYDSYELAESKDSGITVGKVIDGWKEKLTTTQGMRIDQIWCNKKQPIASSKVIFNGKYYSVVSDHYGIVMEYERN